MKEKWININGYKISNTGKIINKRGNEIKGKVSKSGYKTCSIYLGEKYGRVNNFHRVIATVFIPNPNNLPEVNHIDGNKLNNRVDNLEWVTKRENQYHASHILNKRTGKNFYNTNLDDKLVLEIYNKCKNTNMTYKEISELYNVSPDTPAKIAQGITWKYLKLKPINRKDKPIIRIDINTKEIKEYNSIRYAVKDGFGASGISQCCKNNLNNTKIRTYKGFIWKYKS